MKMNSCKNYLATSEGQGKFRNEAISFCLVILSQWLPERTEESNKKNLSQDQSLGHNSNSGPPNPK